MATQIGFIKAIIGEVTAMNADGSLRILKVGDRVFANELITTGPGGAVEIEFADGSVMDLGRSSQALLDDDVFNPNSAVLAESADDAVPDDIAAIQQALLEGEDPTQVGEATAAGAGIAGIGNEGHEPVFVDYLNPAVRPDAGFDTIGVFNSYDLPEEDIIILPEEEEPILPPATVTPPTASVIAGEEGNVVLEDGSISVTVTAQAGDLSDELTGVTITLPAGWTATIGLTEYSGTFTLPASGQSFSQVLLVKPGPEDTDIDGLITAVASARDITDNSVTADSAPASDSVIIDTVLDEAVDVADGNNSGNESGAVQVLSLNLSASTLSPYGQTDGTPADTTESGTATITTTLPVGAVLGTWDGVTFTALASNSFDGTATEVAAWVDSLAVQVPAGYDGDITGSISVTFTDTPTADGNPDTANDTYTDTAEFNVSVSPGQVNPTATVEVGDEGNVVLEDGSIAVTITAEAGDITDELTGVTVTLPDGWTATDGVNNYSGTFELPASGQNFSQVLTVTPGPEDTDVDGDITAYASARDISDNSVTADSAPASGTVVIDTVLDEAVDVADGNTNGAESGSVQVLSLNLSASTLSPYGQTDGAPADASESGTATITTTLPAGAVLGTWDGVTFTALASNSFDGTATEVAAWVDSLAVQVPAGYDGDITGSISVTFTDTPTADGNPDTANDTYTDTAEFNVSIADSLPTNPANDMITVEEESIPGFNGNDEVDGLSYTVNGTFADNADWGVDGFGGIVSVNGEIPVSGTITVNALDGSWSLSVNAATGAYTFTMLTNIASTPFGDNAEGTDNLPTFNVIAQDGDGSQIGFGLGVGIVDDIPTFINPTTSHLKDIATSPDVVQLLNFASGADGVGNVLFDTSLQGTAAMDALGNPLSFNGTGEALFINFSADATQLQFVTKNPDGTLDTTDVKFFIQLNQDGETYTVHSEGIITNDTAVSSATIETIGGGNKAWKAFINLDGTQEDAFLTTKTGDSVNTNNSEIGISDGNSFKFGEGLRIDFLNGVTTSGSGGGETFAVTGPHNLTNSFKQVVSFVGGNQNSVANLTVTAIVANDFDFGAGNDAASHSLFYGDPDDGKVNLSISDITVYDALGQIVTMPAGSLIDNGDSITIIGLKQGWTFEINSDTEFNAVQIDAAQNTATFKLGVFSYGEDSDGLPIELDYDIIGTDSDGDAVTGSLGVNLYPEGSTFEGNDLDNTLNGTNNADYLLGRGGNDALFGLGGDDLLIGGYGNDQLTGGTGKDTFVFSLAADSGDDIIKDFMPGTDKLSFIDVIDVDGSSVIDLGDVINSVADVGGNVIVDLKNGGSVTLEGIGTGSVNDVDALKALIGASNIHVDQS